MSFLLSCLVELKSSGEESPSLCSWGTHSVFISSYSKVRNEEHLSLLLFSCYPVPGHFRPAGLPASLLLVHDMQLSAAPVQVLPTSQAWVGTPASQPGLQPGASIPPRAGRPAGFQVLCLQLGHKGFCSKYTGKTRQLSPPDMAFKQKLGKVGVPRAYSPQNS